MKKINIGRKQHKDQDKAGINVLNLKTALKQVLQEANMESLKGRMWKEAKIRVVLVSINDRTFDWQVALLRRIISDWRL